LKNFFLWQDYIIFLFGFTKKKGIFSKKNFVFPLEQQNYRHFLKKVNFFNSLNPDSNVL
jgi:hypothetical protein